MSSKNSNIDYPSTYFEYPVLDKIHGEPKYDSLKKIKKQLKSNALTVTSSLGGGNHGLLGLVLTPHEYTRLSPTPFLEPLRPQVLAIPPLTQHHNIIRLQNEHEEAMNTYRECKDVKKALLKQIVAAVDATYMNEFRNYDTDSIAMSVHQLLGHLFQIYGQVEPETLAKDEQAFKSYYWDLQDPPVLLFNKIDDLVQMATAANIPKTEAQIINYGLSTIKKTNDFEEALGTWYTRPLVEHSYINFKEHFTTAQRKLKKIRGTRLRDTKFHQANQVSELRADFDRLRDELVSGLNTVTTMYAHEEASSTPQEDLVQPPMQTANATTDMNATMLAFFKEMRDEIND